MTDETADRPRAGDEQEPSAVRQRIESLRGRVEGLVPSADEVTSAARSAGAKAARKAKQIGDAGRDRVDAGYRTVTLRTYRDEADTTLEEIVQVLLAMDARIRELEARLAGSDADSADHGGST